MDADTSIRAVRRAASREVTRVKYVISRRELVLHRGCANCGAAAGQECSHDRGCIDTDRRVR